MSVIFSKELESTVIITQNRRFVIYQFPNHIELSIETIRYEKEANLPLDETQVKLTIPKGIKSLTGDISIENEPEGFIWPVPYNVLADLYERTDGDLKIEDISEYYNNVKPGEEFLIRIKGYILITDLNDEKK